MLSAEQNNLITRIGPGTPAGNLMRHYWQPAALVDELSGARPVKPVRLLGENLVMFRDNKGGYGLIDRMCPHRGTDLAYGRLEDGGLRCLYHGWLFDINGKCIDQPAQPADKKFCDKVKHPAYPVQEKGGCIWAYMGEGQPPLIPDFEFLIAPEANRIRLMSSSSAAESSAPRLPGTWPGPALPSPSSTRASPAASPPRPASPMP